MPQKNHNPWMDNRDMFQVYFDDKICGLPVRQNLPMTDESIGWVADEETYDNGVENDKLLRNKGWMKAPDSYLFYSETKGSNVPARDCHTTARKIATTKHFTGDGEHWLRFRCISAFTHPQGSITNFLDYIEIVPLHIISDPLKPEDRH